MFKLLLMTLIGLGCEGYCILWEVCRKRELAVAWCMRDLVLCCELMAADNSYGLTILCPSAPPAPEKSYDYRTKCRLLFV